jgi:myo-inositol-1(or 4)-monophosphatase
MDFFTACNQVAEDVTAAISPYVGVPEGGKTVKMGADRTPTKMIDQVAEDAVVRAPKAPSFLTRWMARSMP